MDDALRPDDFRSLESPLVVETAPGLPAPVQLVVESVDALPAHRLRPEPFSLVLAGPRDPLLPQATYAVRHPRRGAIQLFIVPIGRDARATRYEVTFN